MRLNQFQYLLSLAEHGSFSKAAQELFVAQPSISQAIKEMEEELGILILRRSNKGISFTPQGKVVLEKAQNIMDEIDSLKLLAQTDRRDVQGNVTIGISPHMLSFLLTAILIDFKSSYPNINLELKEADILSIVKDLDNTKVDLGLIFVCKPDRLGVGNKMKREQLEIYELFTTNMRLVARKDHPLFSVQKPLMLEDTFHYPHIVYSEVLRQMVLDLYSHCGKMGKMTVMNNLDSIRHCVAKTDGITLMIDCLLGDGSTSFENEHLLSLPVEDFQSVCTAVCIRNHGTMTLCEEVILEHLLESTSFYKNEDAGKILNP